MNEISAFGVIHKSWIPGRGYVPAIKAGKEALRRAKGVGPRRGMTAMDRQNAETIKQVNNAADPLFNELKRQTNNLTGPLSDKNPLKGSPPVVANNKNAKDAKRAQKGLKRIGGKRAAKGVSFSPADGPVESATGMGPAALPTHRMMSSGSGFKEGSKMSYTVRDAFRMPEGMGQKMQTKQQKDMIRSMDGNAPNAVTRGTEMALPKMGAPGKMPGGKAVPNQKDAGKQAQEVATHEAAHFEMGSSKQRRKLAAGHTTSKEAGLRATARKVRHDSKATGKAKYQTKEEARADVRTRQASRPEKKEAQTFLSGHDMEEGYTPQFRRIASGVNRTEKRRRKAGKGRYNFVDRLKTVDQS